MEYVQHFNLKKGDLKTPILVIKVIIMCLDKILIKIRREIEKNRVHRHEVSIKAFEDFISKL